MLECKDIFMCVLLLYVFSVVMFFVKSLPEYLNNIKKYIISAVQLNSENSLLKYIIIIYHG